MQPVTANQMWMSLFLSLALTLLCRKTRGVLEKIHARWPRLLSCSISSQQLGSALFWHPRADDLRVPCRAMVAPYSQPQANGSIQPFQRGKGGAASCSMLRAVSELGTKSRFCSTGSTAFDYQTVLPQALGARMCCSGPLADLAGFRYPSSDVVSLLAKNKKN